MACADSEVRASHRMMTLIRWHKVDTMPKDGRYFLIELTLRETLEEIAAGVFEYAGLNDEHAGDICLYYIHNVISFRQLSSTI